MQKLISKQLMMKRIIQLLSCVILLSALSGCESTQQIIKTIEQNYPAATEGGQLSTTDIVAGLKQALEVGAQNSGSQAFCPRWVL